MTLVPELNGFILFAIVFVMITDKRVQLKCDFTVNLFLRAIMPWLRKFLPHPNIARSFGSVYVLRNANGLRASLGAPFLHVHTQFKLGKVQEISCSASLTKKKSY